MNENGKRFFEGKERKKDEKKFLGEKEKEKHRNWFRSFAGKFNFLWLLSNKPLLRKTTTPMAQKPKGRRGRSSPAGRRKRTKNNSSFPAGNLETGGTRFDGKLVPKNKSTTNIVFLTLHGLRCLYRESVGSRKKRCGEQKKRLVVVVIYKL